MVLLSHKARISGDLSSPWQRSWLNKPDEPKLLKAAALLHEERVNFLKKLRGFCENRAKEKAQGQGQPRKAQLKLLYSPDWLLTHDSETQR
jgi:hypothetical protein